MGDRVTRNLAKRQHVGTAGVGYHAPHERRREQLVDKRGGIPAKQRVKLAAVPLIFRSIDRVRHGPRGSTRHPTPSGDIERDGSGGDGRQQHTDCA